MPPPAPEPVVKPKIDELVCCFNRYGLRCTSAGYNPKSWKMAKETLRQELEVFGVASLFDWSED